MKCLIVDDSRAMRMIVMRNLRQAGFDDASFVEAANGLEALALLDDEQPDVILSDWNMPEMDGRALLDAVRAAGLDTTFGFVTSESAEGARDDAVAAGAAFFLTKPFTADDLRTVLDGALGASPGAVGT